MSLEPNGDVDTVSAPGHLADWLLRKGRFRAGVGSLIEGFSRRALEGKLPLSRMTYVVQTLHPLDLVSIFIWRADQPGIAAVRRKHGAEETAMFQDSPIKRVFEGAGEIRRHLEDAGAELDFPILFELREQGFTDYLVLPIRFSNGQVNAVTLATKVEGGFDEGSLDELRLGCRALAPLLEVQEVRGLAATLLDTYLGHHTGTRVLHGAITRGSGETIRAVIWFCDLRGFTELSQVLPREELIALLNDYFGAMGLAVEAEGGEVLKFIGDAMLAVFQLDEGSDVVAICANALKAVARAEQALDACNTERRASGKPEIRFGIALHIGDVLYGNIGAPSRLDFTVIGPAVNLASRLQSVAAELGRAVVLSAAFVEAAEVPAKPLGAHHLKGIEAPQPVFAPAKQG
jgi:adenylate cyclase